MHRPQKSEDLENTSTELLDETQNRGLEDTWRKTYDDCHNRWQKRAACQPGVQGHSRAEYIGTEESPASTSLLRDGSAFRRIITEGDRVPALHQQVEASDADRDVDITAMIKEYTLNAEQSRAFRIVSEHSLETTPEPLRMYIRGPGGTGKSRVINALKSFFERPNQGHRFRLASYTGVVAKNISGMTLHSALSLNQLAKGNRGGSQRDLVAMWEGVDYLFIDEVSMIGCNLLLQISEALTTAKGDTSVFGGINIIFAGDFAQLPPVGQNRLFGHIKTAEVASKHGQNSILGKLLWLSVKTVVLLTEIKRQTGKEN
jgi:hypothetical protein